MVIDGSASLLKEIDLSSLRSRNLRIFLNNSRPWKPLGGCGVPFGLSSFHLIFS